MSAQFYINFFARIKKKLCGDIIVNNVCFTESLCVTTSRAFTKVCHKYN